MEVHTMNELKPRIHDEANGLDYILVGDYYIPAIELPEDDDRPIGKWGRMRNGGGCTGYTWKKRIRFCSTT